MRAVSYLNPELAAWVRKQICQRQRRIKLIQRVQRVDRKVGDWLLTANVGPGALASAIAEVALREAGGLPHPSLYGTFSYRSGASAYSDLAVWQLEPAKASACETVAPKRRRTTGAPRALEPVPVPTMRAAERQRRGAGPGRRDGKSSGVREQ